MTSGILITLSLFIIGACDDAKSTDNNIRDINNTGVITEEKNDNPGKDFALKAAEGGTYEVEMGKLAEMKGKSEHVKKLGKMMAEDHAKANAELKTLAEKKGLELSYAMGNEKQKMFDKLSEKNGEDFDKEYSDMMVDDHEKDIKLFKDQAENGKDADLKTWAQGKVPVLEHHLEMVRTTVEAIKQEYKSNASSTK